MIYLCSPYTHDDESVRNSRFDSACYASALLLAEGIPVIAPLSITLCAERYCVPQIKARTPLSHQEYLDIDLRIIPRCDAVLLLQLDGWKESVGVAQELAEAEKWSVRVYRATTENLTDIVEQIADDFFPKEKE